MKLLLRILTVDDVTQLYVDWFKIPDVTRFSDNQYHTFNLETQKKYLTINKLFDILFKVFNHII